MEKGVKETQRVQQRRRQDEMNNRRVMKLKLKQKQKKGRKLNRNQFVIQKAR